MLPSFFWCLGSLFIFIFSRLVKVGNQGVKAASHTVAPSRQRNHILVYRKATPVSRRGNIEGPHRHGTTSYQSLAWPNWLTPRIAASANSRGSSAIESGETCCTFAADRWLSDLLKKKRISGLGHRMSEGEIVLPWVCLDTASPWMQPFVKEKNGF